jgi:hypothetical protein
MKFLATKRLNYDKIVQTALLVNNKTANLEKKLICTHPGRRIEQHASSPTAGK